MSPTHNLPQLAHEPDLVLPDYGGGGLVNLMSTLIGACGGASPYPPLAALPAAAVAGARHVVLLVIDGLGYDDLVRRGGQLRRHLVGRLTSVFPSTTASAIPTFMTGLAPLAHGLTGWHMYFREIGAIAAPLPFRLRAGRSTLREAGVTPADVFGLEPLFDRLPLPCHVVSPKTLVDSDFNVALSGTARRHGYQSLDDLLGVLVALMEAPARSYIHAYWPQHDSLAHQYGIGSRQVAEAFDRFDAGFPRLVAAAQRTGSVVIVTADHGFVDTSAQETIDLDAHPGVRDALLLPLCGEPRMAYAYVRAGREAQFRDAVRASLSGRVHLVPSADVVRAGWLGAGVVHPALADRLGDYVLIPRGNTILRDWLRGEPRHTQIGVHGGLSAAEMYVPLIVAP